VAKNKWYNKVVQVLESKAGKPYIKFTDDEEAFNELVSRLTPGGAIFLKDHQEELDNSLAEGKLTEPQHKDLSEKTSFVIFEGDIGPSQD